MNISFFIFVISFIFSSYILHAQEVKVNAPEAFNILLHNYEKQCLQHDFINGYRIHITASINRNDLNKMKARIYNEFSGIQPFMSYQAPNFKLRAGNYFYKIDAYKDLQKIILTFSGAFIVPDELKWSEL